MSHKCILRRSWNIAANIVGDKWVCKLCGKYFDYDQKLENVEGGGE